jgi:hypothetical protein
MLIVRHFPGEDINRRCPANSNAIETKRPMLSYHAEFRPMRSRQGYPQITQIHVEQHCWVPFPRLHNLRNLRIGSRLLLPGDSSVSEW